MAVLTVADCLGQQLELKKQETIVQMTSIQAIQGEPLAYTQKQPAVAITIGSCSIDVGECRHVCSYHSSLLAVHAMQLAAKLLHVRDSGD